MPNKFEQTSIKFLKSSGQKFQFEVNNNGRAAFFLSTPNAAKDNWIVEFANSGFGGAAGFPISIGGTLTLHFASTGIIPDVANLDLGSAAHPFKNLFLDNGGVIKVNNIQVVGAQQAHINAPSGGATIDSQARTAIGSILTALQNHGLLA